MKEATRLRGLQRGDTFGGLVQVRSGESESVRLQKFSVSSRGGTGGRGRRAGDDGPTVLGDT